MRILILIPQFIKYCRIMYDYIFQKDRSVFIPIGIKRIRQYSVQLYCRILRTRQSACFIWYSRYPYDNSPKAVLFSTKSADGGRNPPAVDEIALRWKPTTWGEGYGGFNFIWGWKPKISSELCSDFTVRSTISLTFALIHAIIISSIKVR